MNTNPDDPPRQYAQWDISRSLLREELKEKGKWALVGRQGDEEIQSQRVSYQEAVQAMDGPRSKELNARLTFAPTGKDAYVVVSVHGPSAQRFFRAAESYSWLDPEGPVTRTVLKGVLKGLGGNYIWKDETGEEHALEVHAKGFFPYSEDMPTNGMAVRNGQRFLDSLVPAGEEANSSTEEPKTVSEENGGNPETQGSSEDNKELTDQEDTQGDPEPQEDTTDHSQEPVDLAEVAFDLQQEGLNVIPLLPMIPEMKPPFLRQGELKDETKGLFHRRSTPKDIREWQKRDKKSRSKDPNSEWRWESLAVVTGHTSRIFIVDEDSKEGRRLLHMSGVSEELMKKTPSWTTGRGTQIAFRIPEGMEIPTMIKFLPSVDIKGEKGYAVVPPTVHHTGKSYKYITSLIDAQPIDAPEMLINAIKLASGEGISPEDYETLPEEIVQLIKERGAGTQSSTSGSGSGKVEIDPFMDEILVGHRNEVLFKRKACHYRYLGYEKDEIFERLWRDNQMLCSEPLEEDEVREIARKVGKQYKVTRSYVTYLRKGRIESPGFEKLRAIAKAMNFPPELWFEDVEKKPDVSSGRPSWFVDSEDNLALLDEELMEALRDETARAVLREVIRLPERDRRIVLGIVRQFADQQDASDGS